MSLILTQQEADALLALNKYCDIADGCYFPGLGGALRIPLFSEDHREEFSLDITRSRIVLEKNTFQNRARKAVILARLDIGGSPHRNPDGEEIPCPHLHLYREGYGDKWAIPLPPCFAGHDDPWRLMEEFMDFCHIVRRPPIERELFV